MVWAIVAAESASDKRNSAEIKFLILIISLGSFAAVNFFCRLFVISFWANECTKYKKHHKKSIAFLAVFIKAIIG